MEKITIEFALWVFMESIIIFRLIIAGKLLLKGFKHKQGF